MYMIPLSVRYKAFESLCRRPPREAARLGGILLPLAWLGNKQQGEYSPQMVNVQWDFSWPCLRKYLYNKWCFNGISWQYHGLICIYIYNYAWSFFIDHRKMCVFKCEEIEFFPTFMVVAFSTGDDRMWRIQGTPVFVRQTLVNSMVMNPPFFCGLNVSIVGFTAWLQTAKLNPAM